MRQGSHDTALVCLNGHQINEGYYDHREFNVAFCSKCGAETIHECLECQSDIRGYYRDFIIPTSHNAPPDYCHNCGKPYPWTRDRIEAAKQLLQELDELEDDRQKLTDSLPDLVADTPRTALAAERWRKTLAKIGGHAEVILRQLVIEVASETAKKIIVP